MPFGQIFINLPLPLYFLIPFILASISILAGIHTGRRVQKRYKNDLRSKGTQGVTTVLGLLAFILAFTFSMASSRFETRRTLLMDQANAIKTTIMYSDLLPMSDSIEARNLFYKYADLSISASKANRQSIIQIVSDAQKVLDQLWEQSKNLNKSPKKSDIIELRAYTQSLLKVFEFHNKRVETALVYRIPPIVWTIVYLMLILAMFIYGYDIGLAEGVFCLKVLIVALVFSVVLYLIADLDRGAEGLMKISQEPMMSIQTMLNAYPK